MIPGAVATATLTRDGMTSQASDGSPVMGSETIWIKKVHYQPLSARGTDEKQTATGPVARQIYRFWIPFLEGRDKPRLNDQLSVDGYSFRVISIDFEAIRHHITVRTERLDR